MQKETRAPTSWWRRSPWARALLALLGVTSATGIASLISIQTTMTTATHAPTLTTNAAGGTASGAIADTAGGAVAQAAGGTVTQDNSRRLILMNREFRLQVVRQTGQLTASRQEVRDRVLDVVDGLIGALSLEPIPPERIAALSRQLAETIATAPISPYHLTAHHFTLTPGAAFFLPDSAHSLALLGPVDPADPQQIAIKRDGRRVNMTIGAVYTYRDPERTCRLILHDIAAGFAAATFSFTCDRP